jgi:hypothetical protein
LHYLNHAVFAQILSFVLKVTKPHGASRTKDEYNTLENTLSKINRDEYLFEKITRSDFVMNAIMEKIQSMP